MIEEERFKKMIEIVKGDWSTLSTDLILSVIQQNEILLKSIIQQKEGLETIIENLNKELEKRDHVRQL